MLKNNTIIIKNKKELLNYCSSKNNIFLDKIFDSLIKGIENKLDSIKLLDIEISNSKTRIIINSEDYIIGLKGLLKIYESKQNYEKCEIIKNILNK